MWTPDVYQGAPTPVTAFMAAATKAAAFAAILRVFVGAFDVYRVDWRPAIFALAVLSLLVGSIAAVVQTDVKRMLAYQSIAHAGFILIGVEAATRQGTSAALFYVLTYTVMTSGAFAVVAVVARHGDDRHSLSEYRGLGSSRPVLAGLLTLFLLAQAGVPLTGGFIAKLSVFSAAVDVGQYWLALIGMLAAVIGAFVYLRIMLDDVRTRRRRSGAGGSAHPRRPLDGYRAHHRRGRNHLPRHHARHGARLRPGRHPTARALTGVGPRAGYAPLRKRKRFGRATPAGCASRASSARQRELVRAVDQFACAGEVEEVARVTRTREHDHFDLGWHVPELQVEALAARVHEARHHDVERRAFDALTDAGRHVQHEHAVDRAGDRVPERNVVDHAAVDEPAAVVVHDREHARQRGAGEQRLFQRTTRDHDLFAGVEVGGDDPERNLEVGERAGRAWSGG